MIYLNRVKEMSILSKLSESMQEVGDSAEHTGYYYKVSDVLTIMICGMLCNLQNISDIHEWSQSKPVRQFLLEQFQIRKIPSRVQFYNLLSCVEASKFNTAFIKWMQYVLHDDMTGKTIAIDGKTICSTDKLTNDNNPLHIASAIISDNNLVIGSLPCETKISEPEAFRELIKMLDVNGAIVVADALHCRRKSAKTVIDEGGDYLFAVKNNTPVLKENIELFVQNETMEKQTKTEKNGGRFEKRTAYVSKDIEWLEVKEKWADLHTIGAIHTEFEKDKKKTSEWHYYISGAELTADELLKHARLEWSVESMHWLLDVHFAEDKTMVWDMNVQQILNIMRKIALNLAREYKTQQLPTSSISGILKRNLFDINNLAEFLRFFFALINVTVLLQN